MLHNTQMALNSEMEKVAEEEIVSFHATFPTFSSKP